MCQVAETQKYRDILRFSGQSVIVMYIIIHFSVNNNLQTGRTDTNKYRANGPK
jgi:hypothetical protein